MGNSTEVDRDRAGVISDQLRRELQIIALDNVEVPEAYKDFLDLTVELLELVEIIPAAEILAQGLPTTEESSKLHKRFGYISILDMLLSAISKNAGPEIQEILDKQMDLCF